MEQVLVNFLPFAGDRSFMWQDSRQTAMLQLHGRDDDVMPIAGTKMWMAPVVALDHGGIP